MTTSYLTLALGAASTLTVATATLVPSVAVAATVPSVANAWMSRSIVAQQRNAKNANAREAVANKRARALISAMTLEQKMQQLTGSSPELLKELPQCFGARHVSAIPALAIPTFRVSNGPVGVGQNDCVARSVYEQSVVGSKNPNAAYVAYTHPSSAKATALPAAIGVAASFDPKVSTAYGEVIATEMNNLGLHVFEAPGANLARLSILGRNFEYFGEDPYLSGVMAVAEVRSVQAHGLIAMPKHFVANEQETNRQTIREIIAPQVLRELYMLPFEMAVKDGKAGAVMCAYNYVNGLSSCENPEIMTNVLRKDWGFTGYVQSDFFAMKSTVGSLKAGLDHEMPLPTFWSPAKLSAAMAQKELTVADIEQALERRFTQMFVAGIFDRPLVQTSIDFAAGGRKARQIGAKSAVLLQNNDVLPLRTDVRAIVVIGKASQVYAQQAVAGGSITGKPMGGGGGSSDVVPSYTVTPMEGIRNALKAAGSTAATAKLILVDDGNSTATIDGTEVSFAEVLKEAARAEAVLIMAGTIAEEGADRATFTSGSGKTLATSAADGSGLDWYSDRSNIIATRDGKENPARNSGTLAMVHALLGAPSTTAKTMAKKTVLVLKDNAGVAMDPQLVGPNGPAILEVWFPGQEDGNIVADLAFGLANPSGKLPVTFPYAGKGFLDSVAGAQFPGVPGADGKTNTVTYSEQLHIGYRWYDANVSGRCGAVAMRNPCVAFPFGHGLSYTTFTMTKPALSYDRNADSYSTTAIVTNKGKVAGGEVVQAYVSLPASAAALGAVQPPKRLVGFQRIELAPGASGTIEIRIDPAASNHPLEVWNSVEGKWTFPKGEYTLWIGNSSSPASLVTAGTFVR